LFTKNVLDLQGEGVEGKEGCCLLTMCWVSRGMGRRRGGIVCFIHLGMFWVCRGRGELFTYNVLGQQGGWWRREGVVYFISVTLN